MALVVGELMARIGADATDYFSTSNKVKTDAKQTRSEVGKPVTIDGDSKPLEKANERAKKSSQDTGKAIDAAFAAAARSVAADLQKIETEAWKSGKGVDAAFRSSLDDAKQQLTSIRAEAARTGAGLESELGSSLRDIQAKFKQTETAAEETAEGSASAFSEAFGQLAGAGGPVGELLGSLQQSIGSAKGGMLATGLVIGGLLLQGIANAIEEGKVGALIAAQTGAAEGAAGRLGSLAGSIFRQNFGESIEAVGEAMTAVFQNHLIDTSAPEAAIESVTEKVLTLVDTTGEAANEIGRAARQAVLTGLADNVSEALDLIQHATEQGLNTSDDLLDTVVEYGTQFRVLGLDGQSALGLISQAMQAGARDTDTAADALKEFAIRSQDGSETTARGFETIGLNAEEMSTRIAKGGDSARSALRDTLNALRQMPPGVERSTAAVDLFGTKAEDLGAALYSMDLDDAVDQFGDFEGAVDDASAKLSAAVPIYETWGNNLADVMTRVGHAFADARAGFDNLVDGMSGVPGGTDVVRQAYNNMGNAAEEDTGKTKENADAHTDAATQIATEVDTLDELIAKQQEAAGIVLDARDAEREYQEAVADSTEKIAKNGRTHDANTEKGRQNGEALDKLAKTSLDLAAAMAKEGRSTEDVNKVMTNARTKFIQAAIAAGYTRQGAEDLARQLGLIPRNVSTNVSARTQAAAENVRSFKRALDNLKDKTITVSTVVRGANINGSGGKMFLGQASGAVAEYYADGGLRPMSANAAGIVQSYRRTGTMRVIADNPIADEAFIPLQRNNARSQAILDEVLKTMRPNLSAPAPAGALVGAGAASAPGGGGRAVNIVINGPDPQQCVRLMMDELKTRELLYGP